MSVDKSTTVALKDPVCPICGRDLKKPSRRKPLFGVKVCKKCYYALANRRQGAYLIDVLLWAPIAFGGAYMMDWVSLRPTLP